jgi:cytochrome c peroxidase
LSCRAAALSQALSRAKFAQERACFCGAPRKNVRVIFPCHSAVEKRRDLGGRAQAISYMAFPGLFTSLQSCNVGTRSACDDTAIFTTPSLIELWRTAPYLHDGSTAKVMEVLTTRNPHD